MELPRLSKPSGIQKMRQRDSLPRPKRVVSFQRERRGMATRSRERGAGYRVANRAREVNQLTAGIGLPSPSCSRTRIVPPTPHPEVVDRSASPVRRPLSGNASVIPRTKGSAWRSLLLFVVFRFKCLGEVLGDRRVHLVKGRRFWWLILDREN